MGKYRHKLKKNKNRNSRSCVSVSIDRVTTWGYQPLDLKTRDMVEIHDVVRILMGPRKDDDNLLKIYVRILKIDKEYLTGIVEDPYHGELKICCNECRKYIGYYYYRKTVLFCDKCDYHICEECRKSQNYDLQKINKHEHKLVVFKDNTPFINGTIITFKRNSIIEIPNWTKNTEYLNTLVLSE